MSEADDAQLLRDYARHGSEAAFGELVQRYVGLVYSAAVRHAGVAAHAEEITQAVFIILARKATGLRSGIVLASWLHATTRLTALSFLRGERRRQLREQEAYMQSTLQETASAPVWPQLAPLLDEAISRLGGKDRDALVLRFFKEKEVAEVAASLLASEAATYKRVNRALEKLRAFFAKHGISSTTAVIAREISTNSIQAPPPGLAAAVTAAAIAKGVAASASTLTLIKGALKIMAWTKAKTAIVAGAAAILGISVTTVGVESLWPMPDIQGTWEGTLNLPDAGVRAGELPKTRWVLRVTGTNGSYLARFDDIDRGYKEVGFNTFQYQYPSLHGEIPSLHFSYAGKVSRFGRTISGEVTQGTNSLAVAFKRTAHPPAFPEPLAEAEVAPRADSDLQGVWTGMIRTGKGGLHVKVEIAEPSNKTFRADFYSLDQGTNRQPTSVSYDGTTVKIMPMAGYGMFQGRLGKGGKELSGAWIQGGRRLPTTLARAD